MIELGRGLGLCPKPLALAGGGQLGGPECFDRHAAIERELASLVNDPHAAASDFTDQLIISEPTQARLAAGSAGCCHHRVLKSRLRKCRHAFHGKLTGTLLRKLDPGGVLNLLILASILQTQKAILASETTVEVSSDQRRGRIVETTKSQCIQVLERGALGQRRLGIPG